MSSYVLVGMQYGDEGKGSFVDFLANEQDIDSIVRFNGGSQASHTVVTSEGMLHKFSQLGSGMFYSGTETYITENVVVNLKNLYSEAEMFAQETGKPLEDILKRIKIHEDCYMVTSYHILMNMLRELSMGEKRRGSVGTGVSEVRRILEEGKKENPNGELLGVQVKDLLDKNALRVLKRKYRLLYKHVKRFYEKNCELIWRNTPNNLVQDLHRKIYFLLRNHEAYEIAANIYYNFFSIGEGKKLLENISIFQGNAWEENEDKKILYEGAQGLLLDVKFGTRPNTTFLDTTAHFAYELNKNDSQITRIGVAKAFCSRHGLGAFPTEDSFLNRWLSDEHQTETFWNGKIRFGWFDAVLMRYAQKVNQVDVLYLSSMDQLDSLDTLKICHQYEYIGEVDEEFGRIFDYSYEENGIILIHDIKEPSERLGYYLANCIPQYLYGQGWKQKTAGIHTKEELPEVCLGYIRLLESLIKIPITVISVGSTKEDKIRLK